MIAEEEGAAAIGHFLHLLNQAFLNLAHARSWTKRLEVGGASAWSLLILHIDVGFPILPAAFLRKLGALGLQTKVQFLPGGMADVLNFL